MKHVTKHRPGPVVLLALILFQGIGWFLAWQAIEWQAKYAAQSVLFKEETPVRKIVLQQDLFRQSKIGRHELCLDGNLYDIRSCQPEGDSVRLVLFHDVKEQMLFSMLGVHLSKLDRTAQERSQPLTVWVAQWLGSAFILPDAASLTVAGIHKTPRHFYWSFPRTSGLRPPPFTPPRIVFVTG